MYFFAPRLGLIQQVNDHHLVREANSVLSVVWFWAGGLQAVNQSFIVKCSLKTMV